MRQVTIIEVEDYLATNTQSKRKGTKDYLTDKETGELAKLIREHKLDSRCFIWGNGTIRIINYVGYIQLSTVSIEILPKISKVDANKVIDGKQAQKTLLDMLYHSGYCSENLATVSQLDNIRYNLFELIGYVFAERLKRELMKGAVSSYIPVENNSPVLRGKLLVSKHITNIISGTGKAYCQHDEFSMDNILNRILKRVVILLLGKVSNVKTLNLLKFCLLHLADVDEVVISVTDFDKVKFDRTNSRFTAVFSLARLLILGQSSLNAAGRNVGFAMLFRMDELFESYITAVIKKCTQHEVRVQDEKHYLAKEEKGKECFLIKPDIVIRHGDKELIIDTKWKNLKKDNYIPKREDYLQMYTYLARYELAQTGILLYPRNADDDTSKPLKSYELQGVNYERKNKKLKVYTVDYEDVEKTKENLRQIIQDVCIEENRQVIVWQ